MHEARTKTKGAPPPYNGSPEKPPATKDHNSRHVSSRTAKDHVSSSRVAKDSSFSSSSGDHHQNLVKDYPIQRREPRSNNRDNYRYIDSSIRRRASSELHRPRGAFIIPKFISCLSESVISVLNSAQFKKTLVVIMWLLLMLPVEGDAMSSDQTDTFTSICDEPGCVCSSGRITCSCTKPNQNVVLSTLIPPTTSIIFIEFCDVEIEKNALHQVRALTQVVLSNVGNLKLNENSFSWDESFIQEIYATPGLHINLTASVIPTLPTYVFRGRIDSILFDRVEIQRIESYAFTNIVGTEKIEFKNCVIGRVDTQAFKKIFLDKITFSGGSFTEPIPSKSMLDIEIKSEFKIDGVTMNKIHSSAFKIARAKQFYLKNCIINDTEGESFKIKTNGPVFILNNVFSFLRTGAFNGLRVDETFLLRYEEQELIFENNTIVNYETDALIFNTSSFEPHLDRVKVDLPCSCVNTDNMINSLIVFADNYPYQKTKLGTKAEEFLWCQNIKDKTRYKMVKEYRQKTSCLMISTGIPTYIITIGLLIIPIIGLALLYYFWWRRRRLKWMGVPTESPTKNTTVLAKNGKRNTIIVMPEGKTYRETELHVIVEKAEPIIEYIPEDPTRRKSGQIPPLTSDL